MPTKLKIEKGQKFNRLTIVREVEKYKTIRQFECECECGKKVIVTLNHLRSNHTTSCGCYNKEVITKHGDSFDLTYVSYMNMKQRCNNPKSKDYHNYGGRGIKINKEFDTYLGFKTYLLESGIGLRPNKEMTLDRINNDGNYEPGNIRWSTLSEQIKNRRKFKRKKNV